jgi:DNA-binding Lrp family transcriptional regulator
MSIGNWLLGKLTHKLTPRIEQMYVVLDLVDSTLKEILKKLPEAGIPTGTVVYVNIKALSNAVYVIKATIVNILVNLGGTIPNTTTGYKDLGDEVEKLKDMLT